MIAATHILCGQGGGGERELLTPEVIIIDMRYPDLVKTHFFIIFF
jgi:hypothetical protein